MDEIEEIISEISKAGKLVFPEAVRELSEEVRSHKRIFSYATGRSGLEIKAFAMRMMQLGFVSYVVGETTTPSLGPGDLLVLASASGETESVVSAARSAAKQGVDLFVISSQETSSLSAIKKPDVLIRSGTKFATSDASVQPLGSLFEQMLLIYFDSVSLHLAGTDEETLEQMAARHASVE